MITITQLLTYMLVSKKDFVKGLKARSYEEEDRFIQDLEQEIEVLNTLFKNLNEVPELKDSIDRLLFQAQGKTIGELAIFEAMKFGNDFIKALDKEIFYEAGEE